MRNLNAIRIFVRVAEARSFTGAGRVLGLTSSAVSKAILRLEHELGVRLLNRTTRHVRLTDDGLDFYEHCRQVLADIQEAESKLMQATSVLRGRLKIQMPVGFGKRIVLPALAQRLAAHPELRVDVELGERQVDLAEEGVDVVVRFGSLPDSGLIAQRLCDVSFVPCASPGYIARYGEPATPEDLDRHLCLGYVTPWSDHYRGWPFAHDGRAITRHLSGRLNVNNAESLLEMAVAGAGVAMISAFVAYDAVRSGALRVLLREYLAPGIPVSVAYLPGRQRTQRVRWFLEVLRDLVPDPAPWEDIAGER